MVTGWLLGPGSRPEARNRPPAPARARNRHTGGTPLVRMLIKFVCDIAHIAAARMTGHFASGMVAAKGGRTSSFARCMAWGLR